MNEIREIDIPDSVYVHCPLAGFRLTRVIKCAECPHFQGLADRAPQIPEFGKRYMVLCVGDPTKRQIHEVI